MAAAAEASEAASGKRNMAASNGDYILFYYGSCPDGHVGSGSAAAAAAAG